jgi:hypothetical protein
MEAKFTRLTHKIAIQLHLVAESCTICSSRSRWPVWKLLVIRRSYKKSLFFTSVYWNRILADRFYPYKNSFVLWMVRWISCFQILIPLVSKRDYYMLKNFKVDTRKYNPVTVARIANICFQPGTFPTSQLAGTVY